MNPNNIKKLTQKNLSESQIMAQIKDKLSIMQNQGKLWFMRNNSGALPVQGQGAKSRFIRFGQKDAPDILGYFKQDPYKGRSFFIEVKRKGGRISPGQKEFIDSANESGCLAIIADSYESFERNFKI